MRSKIGNWDSNGWKFPNRSGFSPDCYTYPTTGTDTTNTITINPTTGTMLEPKWYTGTTITTTTSDTTNTIGIGTTTYATYAYPTDLSFQGCPIAPDADSYKASKWLD